MNYINIEEFLSAYTESKEKGFIIAELQHIFDQMIYQMLIKYSSSSYTLRNNIEIITWKINDILKKDYWMNYNPPNKTNIYAYFTEVFKRCLASTHNKIDEIKFEYYIIQRKAKLEKLNAL